MHVLTMSTKGQLTVPKELRDALGLTPGTRVQASIDDRGRLVLTPARFEPRELFEGRPPVDRLLAVEEMDERVGQAFRDRR